MIRTENSDGQNLEKVADADADLCLQVSNVKRLMCDREREREQRCV